MEQQSRKQKKAVAIRVKGVTKEYVTGEFGGTTLQRELQSWWAKKRGREDPNVPIGMEGRIGKRFNALEDIDLTVYEGETLGIIGRNGAGKSTLLKLMCRITAPTKGRLDLYGRIASMLEVGTGFHGEMTGRENVYLNGMILGMTRKEIDERMDDIIEFSEIGDFIDTPIKRYSSGMVIKLGFSVAAHLASEIMIMDEVLAVGDLAFQQKCIQKMQEEAAKNGRTILYVSHNLRTIRQLCSRCIVMDHGRILFDGDVEKAIAVYMRREQEELLSLDFLGKGHPEWLPDPSIQLIRAAYVGRESNVFEQGEKLRFTMRWEILHPVRSAGLRVELWTMDDIPQGTYIVEHFLSGEPGEVQEAQIDLDIDSIGPGVYRMVYSFYITDEWGENYNLENQHGLCFEKKAIAFDGKWDPRNWGYFRLPGIRLEMKKTGEDGAASGIG